MDPLLSIIVPLLLLLAANGAPILARGLLGGRLDAPIDGGLQLSDGRPLFGPTKSWRGLCAALLLTSCVALLLGLPWWLGALFGLFAMVGDLLSSFIKRRINIAPHGRAAGLDQLPEALLPLWLLNDQLGVDMSEIVAIVVLFWLISMLLSPLIYRLQRRKDLG